MAKEIVVTSVPRGVKHGRTGFQTVMRTAGVSDDLMTSLEQLAVYRHIPQGSGRNPVIYSFRSVRGATGQLNVLGRTVDAGIDFSNRSNKLSHLLAVDPNEMAALRNSSPAAVLAANEARLATVWKGGPEERAAPFALSAPPVQPAVCHRWEGVTGDAGWGGVLAQRAMRGQPSLVIAPDCSPAWCRTLLELFQEAFALLPPDNRWRTTFDTTVIGSSLSSFRGTYAGSPESAAGHAGLLIVDLSSRNPVPANLAADDFVAVARQGPKQSVARAPSRGPSMPPSLEEAAGPMLPVGQTAAGQAMVHSHRPPTAPGSWDEDEPKSRLHWYILCSTLLAAIVLVAGSVAVWYWLDVLAAKGCQDKIYAYADSDVGKPFSGDTQPTLGEWQHAFWDDNNIPVETEFSLLLSALATKAIDRSRVESAQRRSDLLSAVQGVLQGKDVLTNAEKLGVHVTAPEEGQARTAVASLVAGWIAANAKPPKVRDVNSLQRAIDAATQVVAAAFDKPQGKLRQVLGEASVEFLWPGRLPPATRSKIMQRFRETLAANKAGLTYNDAANTLNSSVAAIDQAIAKEKTSVIESTPDQMPQFSPAELASQAFTALQEALIQYEPRPSGEIDAKPVILASDLDAKNLTFTLSLPSVGNWKPKVESPSAEAGDQRIWKLTGLPDDLHKHWGTVRLDRGKGNLTFKSELGANEPRDHLYVPFIFASDASPTPQLITLPAVAAPDEVEASRADGQSCSLSDVLTGDAVSLKMSQSLKVAPSLLGGPNVLKMTLNSGRPNGTRVLELETRAGNGSLESTTDLWCTIADGDANKGRRVWLESLESKFDAADGGLTVLLSRKDSQPWTARVTRFKARDLTQPWPPLSAEWNRDKFVRLFKVMLDEGHRNPKNTVDALEKKIDTALSLKPTEQKMRLQAWRDQAFDFVKKQEGPFHAFVQAAFVRERGKRPQSPPPPEAPASEADAEAMNKYKIAKSKYDATKVSTDKAIEEWNADLDQWLCSPLWLARFLDESPGQDGDTDPHDFARAVLGIDAWIALHDKVDPVKKECSEILLETLVSATLSLLWKMPQEGGPIPVKRFEIKHGGKEVKVTQPDEQRQ